MTSVTLNLGSLWYKYYIVISQSTLLSIVHTDTRVHCPSTCGVSSCTRIIHAPYLCIFLSIMEVVCFSWDCCCSTCSEQKDLFIVSFMLVILLVTGLLFDWGIRCKGIFVFFFQKTACSVLFLILFRQNIWDECASYFHLIFAAISWELILLGWK